VSSSTSRTLGFASALRLVCDTAALRTICAG
jgi:hypothetical protein